MNKPIGFIGLGNMGSGMVINLVKATFEVLAFDLDNGRLLSSTAPQAKSPEDIAQKCETVILCLPNPGASRTVIFDQLLTGGSTVSTIIETSTLTPEIVKEFSDKLAAKNVQFLSAPMVGGKNQAAQGTIEFLVEGSEACYQANRELLAAMGKSRYMGAAPSATLAKLTFNLCRYANLAVGMEAYRLLKQYNANTTAIHQFMSEQSLDNFGQVWAEDLKDTMTKDIVFKPSQVPYKDLSLLIEMAESHGVDKDLIAAIRQTYSSMQ